MPRCGQACVHRCGMNMQVPAGLAALAAGAGAEEDSSSEGSYQPDVASPKLPDPKACIMPSLGTKRILQCMLHTTAVHMFTSTGLLKLD